MKKKKGVKKNGEPKLPTNALMDSFQKYCEAIRKTKPSFTRFKDGNLIKNASRHISKFQIEMLFIWFLKEKRNMQPTVGAALCKEIIRDFMNASHKEYGFYNKLEQLANQYMDNKRNCKEIKLETDKMLKALEKLKADFSKKVKPFSPQERTQITETNYK
mgnify:CR=1 FL=1